MVSHCFRGNTCLYICLEPCTGLNNTTNSNPTACVAATATYTVIVTDINGCSASSDVVLNINPLPKVYDVTGGDTLICPSNSVPIGLDTTQAGISYVLILNGTPPGIDTLNGTGTAITFGNYSAPGVYTVIAFDPVTGCEIKMADSAVITNYPIHIAIISGPNIVCAGTTGNIYLTQSFLALPTVISYTWNISAGGTPTAGGTSADSTITITWNTPGQQVVTVIDTFSNGCSVTATDTVTVNPLPIPTISGPTSVCEGLTGNVYSTECGMSGYTWSVSAGGAITGGGGLTDCTVTVTWNTSGAQTVSVNYTDANGCTATSATVYNIIVDPLSVAPTSATVDTTGFCQGTIPNITLTAAGGSGTTLHWSTSCGGSVIGNDSIDNKCSEFNYDILCVVDKRMRYINMR